MKRQNYTVLLGDDSEDDRFFMRRIIRRLPQLNVIAEMSDGEAVISYLDGLPPFADRTRHPLPDLMILDLKMPRKGGHDVLRWLQINPLPGLAVIIVSGSCLPADLTLSLELGASIYYTKSAQRKDQEAFLGKIREILDIPIAPSPALP
jgi:CheY-like chemotaxis protein